MTYRYTDDSRAREDTRAVHREYMGDLADRGVLLLAGPYGPTEEPGALMLFRAEDKTQVKSLVDADPFIPAGVVAAAEITHWDLAIAPILREI